MKQRRNYSAEYKKRGEILSLAKNNMQSETRNIAQRKNLFANRKSPLVSANCRKQEKKAFQIVMQFDNEI
jgi:hypothetical protein